MKKILLALMFVLSVISHLSAQDSEWFAEKFPAKLIRSSGKEVDTAAVLKGKMVAVYFSASWCGPCRGFTPQLIKFYKRTAKKEGLEIVFVSHDRNDKEMQKYFKKMPWLAIPFDDPAIKQLKQEFRVNGIPHLIVFDKDGKVLSKAARWDVVMLENKAVDAWKSPDYSPKTYQDYKGNRGGKNKGGRNRRSRRR